MLTLPHTPSPSLTLPHTLPRLPTCSPSLTLPHTLPRLPTCSPSLTLPLTPSHTPSLTHMLTLPHPPSLPRPPSPSLTLPHMPPHPHAHPPSPSLTLPHTPSLTHMLTLPHTLSLTHMLTRLPSSAMYVAKEVAFQINHTEKSFHAFAASDSDKENWVRNLTTYISRARETKGDTHARTCMHMHTDKIVQICTYIVSSHSSLTYLPCTHCKYVPSHACCPWHLTITLIFSHHASHLDSPSHLTLTPHPHTSSSHLTLTPHPHTSRKQPSCFQSCVATGHCVTHLHVMQY